MMHRTGLALAGSSWVAVDEAKVDGPGVGGLCRQKTCTLSFVTVK